MKKQPQSKSSVAKLSVAARTATAKVKAAKPKARWAATLNMWAARKAARQALHATMPKGYTDAQWMKAKRAAKLV